jgi:ankyrin repeat protein
MLLAAGANPNLCLNRDCFWTPIHIAVKHGYLDILTTLLDNKGDPNAGLPAGRPRTRAVPSPLHIAASQKVEICKLLIERGADPTATDGNGEPPLFLAIRARAVENMRVLADPQTADLKNYREQSALHIAAESGHVETVEFLLEQRPAQVHCLDEAQNTPLHNAVAGRHREAAQLLLDAGSDVMLRNDAGESVFTVATGEFRVMVQRFAAAHPAECRPSPIQRRRGRSSIGAIESPPGRLGNRRAGSHGSGSGSAAASPGPEAPPEDLEAIQASISGQIESARAAMQSQIEELRRLLGDLKEDANR